MATYANSTMQQMPYVHPTIREPRHNYQPAPQVEKPNATVQSTTTETAYPVDTQVRPVKEYYLPVALRTSCLAAFAIIICIVSVLVQIAAAASLGAPGLESLAVSSSNEKRTVNIQPSSTPSDQDGTISAPSPTIGEGAPPIGSWSGPASTYFLGAYVPTFIAITFGIWWRCVFARLKEIEPFYQLSNPGGVEAKDSLLLSYFGSMLPMVLLKSLRSRHWLTLVGAANSLLFTLCTLFASSTLYLRGEGDGCGVIANAVGDVNKECDIHLKMQPALGFALGIFLGVVALLAILVIIILERRPPRIFAEANSIAGIASLTTAKLSQASQQSFQGPGPRCRYALASPSSNKTVSIIELPPVALQTPHATSFLDPASVRRPTRSSHREMKPLSLVLFLIFEVGILTLIVYYGFISKPDTGDALEDFMDSDSFGLRVFMASLGLGTKFYWGWIENYMHRTAPYVALASPKGATPEQSILLQSHGHPLIALFSRGTWRNLLTGIVTLMAFLSEILVIMLTAVPFTTATAYEAHQISVYISIIILGVMVLIVPAVLFWQTRIKETEVPEMPECIADVLALIADERRWSVLGMLSDEERRRVVNGWGNKFGIRRVHDVLQVVSMNHEQP